MSLPRILINPLTLFERAKISTSNLNTDMDEIDIVDISLEEQLHTLSNQLFKLKAVENIKRRFEPSVHVIQSYIIVVVWIDLFRIFAYFEAVSTNSSCFLLRSLDEE